MKKRWILAAALMSVSATAWAAPHLPDVSVRTLSDYKAIGRPYQPVGNWKDPGELAITLRVSLEDGSILDRSSLESEVKGGLIRLTLVLSKPAHEDKAKDDGDEQVCKPYTAGAEVTYLFHRIPQHDYRIELLGSHPVAPAPLHTLQQAKAEGLPQNFVVTVPQDGFIHLDKQVLSIDDLDILFTRAEPYQIPVLVLSQSTSSLAVEELASGHALPYQFPNYDKLLMQAADETEAKYKDEDKLPPRPPGPWRPYGEHSKLPLVVTLALASPAEAGKTPRFKVTLANQGKYPIRIADFASRRYLMGTYLELHLTQGGKPVQDIPVAINDPGLPSLDDLMLLPAGGKTSVNYSGFPYALDHLKPGRYEATLVFYFDEMRTQRYVESGTLAFEVK